MFTLNCKGRLLTASKPLVMGIINITPDSFYHESRRQDTEAILQKAGRCWRKVLTSWILADKAPGLAAALERIEELSKGDSGCRSHPANNYPRSLFQ